VKRVTLVAALAMVFALVPAMTAGYAANRQAGVSAQDTNAHIHLMNLLTDWPTLGAAAVQQPVDVTLDGAPLVTNFANLAGFDFSTPVSTPHVFNICKAGTAATCTGANLYGTTTLTFAQGQFDAALVDPAGPVLPNAASVFLFSTVNNLTSTALGNARFTVHNLTGGSVDVCVNGTKIFTGVANTASAEKEFPEAINAAVNFEIPSAAGCPGTAKTISFAAGTNLVLTLGGDATLTGAPGSQTTTLHSCTTGCSELFFVGQGRPVNAAATAAFCAALNPGLTGIQAEVKATLGTVTTSPPSIAAVKQLVTDINTLVAAGDASVPATVLPQWEQATSGLRTLSETLTAVSFDVSTLTAAQRQQLQDGANGVNQAANPALDAATTVLTNFFLTSCVTAAVTPKFTG
jgi:hypothetical protein